MDVCRINSSLSTTSTRRSEVVVRQCKKAPTGLTRSLAQGHFSMEDVLAVMGTVLQQDSCVDEVATHLLCTVIKQQLD